MGFNPTDAFTGKTSAAENAAGGAWGTLTAPQTVTHGPPAGTSLADSTMSKFGGLLDAAKNKVLNPQQPQAATDMQPQLQQAYQPDWARSAMSAGWGPGSQDQGTHYGPGDYGPGQADRLYGRSPFGGVDPRYGMGQPMRGGWAPMGQSPWGGSAPWGGGGYGYGGQGGGSRGWGGQGGYGGDYQQWGGGSYGQGGSPWGSPQSGGFGWGGGYGGWGNGGWL